jgi:hypothetical protein
MEQYSDAKLPQLLYVQDVCVASQLRDRDGSELRASTYLFDPEL